MMKFLTVLLVCSSLAAPALVATSAKADTAAQFGFGKKITKSAYEHIE